MVAGEAMPPLPLVTVCYIIAREICPRGRIAAAVFKNYLLAASRASRQIRQQFVAAKPLPAGLRAALCCAMQ